MRKDDPDGRRVVAKAAKKLGWRMTMVARLRTYLFAGIIVTAPIGITVLIVWQVVRYFDETVNALVPGAYNPETYLPFSIPGIGFVMILGFLIMIGWFTAGLVGRTLMRAGERLLDRTPVVRGIYGTLKQIFETIFTKSGRAFREVVLIEYPRRDCWALGFVTGRTAPELTPLGAEDLVNVLVPMSPFPSSGFLLFVPQREIVHLDMTVEEGMRIILSGGIVAPGEVARRGVSAGPSAGRPGAAGAGVAREEVEEQA